MAQQHPLLPARTTRTHLLRLLPVVAALCLTGWMAAFSTDPAYAQSGDSEETCPGGGYNPTPTAVEIKAVPIVVESTTSDYFVLYVQHDVDEDTSIEIPVLIEKGAADTTTLAENVEALPKERYRVEKYQIANPADIDGDCIDDMTELQNLGKKNPLNPAAAIALSDGAVAIPDRDAFETLAYSETYLKFVLFDLNTSFPRIYFVNTKTHDHHREFLSAMGLQMNQDMLVGKIFYGEDLVAPDDVSLGVYTYRLPNSYFPISLVERSYTALAASMPLLRDNLAFNLRNSTLSSFRPDLPLYSESRVNLVFDTEVYGDTGFLALNTGVGVGLLREMEPDERPNPRDVVIYEALPNDLPRVAGIISAVLQTPLSHINLRAVQDGVPNAYISDALDEDDDIDDLIGSYVRYTVTEDGYSISEATRAEVNAHHAALRPAHAQTPQRDLSVTAITSLSEVGFDDWDAFGVKAANVAVLGTLEFSEGTVPDGFAIPFYFYDEFMKHNDFYDDIDEMLADADFQTDFDTQAKELKKLRKDIQDGETPAWIVEALTTMNDSFDEGINRRYRSSTNNEDLPGFSGAGLYSSKSQKPSEDEEDLAKSLKEVYASLWNFRAFVERDFHRIDHKATAMGILVHPSYQDELVNGVAVSIDPAYGTEGTYYVNSQVGEDLVTNPEAHSAPEELLLRPDGSYIVIATSNKVSAGQLLMSDAQLQQLRRDLTVIHTEFKKLYQPAADDPFAMEIEFKITSENKLAIKQARPWVFRSESQAGDTSGPPPTVTISGTAQVGQTLTADTSGITDEDGLTNVSYSYQWVRNDGNADTDIEGATASTHELLDSDEGKTVRVKVSFTDDADNEESRTSAATATVAPRPALTATFPSSPYQSARHKGADDRPQVIIAFSLPVKSFTKATPSVLLTSATVSSMRQHQEDGLENAWIFFLDPDGNEDIGFSLVAGQPCDGGGICTEDGDALSQGAAKTLPGPQEYEPQPDDQQQNNPATGAPTISGTAQVGETLTADTSAIDDADGLANVAYRHQWIRSDNGADSDIAGATDSTYTLVLADQGKTIKVKVTFTDDRDNEETLTSVATVTVAAAPNRAATGAPTINGTPQVGETLTADTANIADQDGLDDVSYRYQWTAGGADIDGATGSSHTLTASEQGKTIQVKVTFTDDRNNAETLTSVATEAVAATVPTEPLSLSVATGDQVQELEASWQAPSSNGGSAVTGYKVQWKEAADSWDTAADVSEAAETGTTYTITSLTGGVEYAVRVIATNDAGDGPASTEAKGTPAGGVSEQVVEPENNAPTGLPGIGGTPQVDQTLTADTSPIDDADGLENVSYGYQWIAGGTDIDGATGSSYTLTASELGQTIQVRVTFTDDADNQESLTSEATAAAAAPASLTAAFQDLPDSHDGSTTFTFRVLFSEDVGISYVNMRDDALSLSEGGVTGARRVDGRNDLWEITVEPDDNSDVGITLPANRSCATTGAICTREDNPRQLTNSPTATVTGPAEAPPTNNAAAGAPTVSGTPQVGQTLTADTSSITDEDGLTNVSYRYQWMAGGSDIDGATGSTYTLTASEQGQTVQVRVTFTDDADNEEILTSEATVAVAAAPNRDATGAPTIGGTPQVEQTLTADTSPIDDEDGLTNVSYRYQWIAGGSDIGGAAGSTYTLTSSEQGKTIQVRVTFTDDLNNAETLTSAATVEVAAAPAPLTASLPDSRFQSARHNGADDRPQVIVAFSLPVASFEKTTPSVSLTGAAVSSVRQHEEDGLENAWIFFLDPDGDGDILFSLATGQPCDSGGICTEDGRTLSLGVQVTLPGPDEESEPDNPEPDDPNSPATGAPTISGTPQVDQTLTADTSPIDDQDGLTNVSYRYQWTAGGSDIDGATGSSYTLTDSEQGKTIQVRVTFTDDRDNEETLTSIATAAVAAAPEPLTVSLKTAVPDSHDGSAEFTFEIEFSEEFGLGYATLRDHAFNVTGGSVETAQRTDKPSNIPWLITVKPQGAGDVTIELPATTDCGATGAICTGDGRKLSNSLSFTVSGPGQ